MNKRLLSLLALVFLIGFSIDGNAQRGRTGYYGQRPYSSYHSRPRVMISIGSVMGGVFGGSFGSGYYGYGWGPGFGINIVIPPSERYTGQAPSGATKRVYGGITYYYRNNTYYRKRKDGGFEMVEPPLGASLDRIPQDARLRKIDGEYFYEYRGAFYQMKEDENEERYYIVVGKNGDLMLNDAYERRFGKEEGNTSQENLRTDTKADTEKMPIVKNGNAEQEETTSPKHANPVLPQAGDKFDELPANCKEVTINGEKLFVSPNGVYYKKRTTDEFTYYEVVKMK